MRYLLWVFQENCLKSARIRKNGPKTPSPKQLWCAKNDTHKALGDLLVFLSALGATEGAKNSFDFATKIGIRIAGLKEVRKLRRLIVHAVNRLDDGSCSLDQKVIFWEKYFKL